MLTHTDYTRYIYVHIYIYTCGVCYIQLISYYGHEIVAYKALYFYKGTSGPITIGLRSGKWHYKNRYQ